MSAVPLPSVDALLALVDALDGRFVVFWSRHLPPPQAAIRSTEQALDVPFEPGFRAFLSSVGCMALTVSSQHWPRPLADDPTQPWRQQHTVQVYGLAPDVPAPLDVRWRFQELPHQGILRVPVFSISGSAITYAFDAQGRYWLCQPDSEPSLLPGEGFTSLLSRAIRDLQHRADSLLPAQAVDPTVVH